MILRNVLKWPQFPVSMLGPTRNKTDPEIMSEVVDTDVFQIGPRPDDGHGISLLHYADLARISR